MPMSPPASTVPPSLSTPKTPSSRIRSDIRTPSPNYFGFAVNPHNTTVNSAASASPSQWASVDTEVRSTAAASPQILTHNTNTNGFEAFRQQSDHNPFFNLSSSSLSIPTLSSHSKLPPVASSSTPISPPRLTSSPLATPSSRPSHRALSSTSQIASRSPKRLLSSDASNLTDDLRRHPLPSSSSEISANAPSHIHVDRQDEHKQPRLSLPHHIPEAKQRPSIGLNSGIGSPAKTDDATFQTVMESPQHVFDVISADKDQVLLLDLRVSTQYARSRISGALNLCVPTTLLKRPAYTVEKLAETFKANLEQRQEFEAWRSCRYIVVYDGSATQLKEATSCVNVLKKFSSEGWTGNSCIIRGGFADFERKFPELIDRSEAGSASQDSHGLHGASLKIKGLAPVIGGCPMPASKNAANPFFGNIRQNMDLIGGVGQMPIACPTSLKSQAHKILPAWLASAAEERDHGKRVADMFLQIEKREQKRMQDALSCQVSYEGTGQDEDSKVKIAGLEKGAKNRYNNIFPFEHSRVRLTGVPSDGCDYVNASFVRTSRSPKRYIATQGPIPATFGDFWNMVWQRDVRVIVMLTAESEGGQIKAHNYWDGHSYGPIKIRALSEHKATLEPHRIHKRHSKPIQPQRSFTNPSDLESQASDMTSSDSTSTSSASTTSSSSSTSSEHPYVTVRKFSIRHTSEPFQRLREVTQLQYSHWPDFGTPAHPTHLLGIVEHCNAVTRASSLEDGQESQTAQRPVLVHCSAGCGRTGTFCTVDTVMDLLQKQRTRQKAKGAARRKDQSSRRSSGTPDMPDVGGVSIEEDEDSWLMRDDEDLIEQTVEEFRLQRLSMVQSLRQYVLCYESVLEWIAQDEPPWTA